MSIEETHRWTLVLSAETTTLTGPIGTVRAVVDSPPIPDVRTKCWDLVRSIRRAHSATTPTVGPASVLLDEIGSTLGRIFLADEVGSALSAGIDRARRSGAVLTLGFGLVNRDLADLPWEVIVLPGVGPLALEPTVALHRLDLADGLKATFAASQPGWRRDGPLRVLIAIAAQTFRAPTASYSTWRRSWPASSVRSSLDEGRERSRRRSSSSAHCRRYGPRCGDPDPTSCTLPATPRPDCWCSRTSRAGRTWSTPTG